MKQIDEVDIFEFWKEVGPSEKVHPADREILFNAPNKFDLDCLPTPFYGPLRTAPIVLLYTNPGHSDKDKKAGSDPSEQQFYFRQRQGNEWLRDQRGLTEKSWWVSRTKRICADPEYLRSRVAVLELCPYHSSSFVDAKMARTLPSYQTALGWAHQYLFPMARARERVVICLRAAKRWGLQRNASDGFLFAPGVNRSGHMLSQDRDVIIQTARKIIGLDSGSGACL